MPFNTHTRLVGRHAILSASKYHWVNYDEDKIDRLFLKQNEAVHGSKLHDLAKMMIELGVYAERVDKTFNMYVNDCIGFRMEPEVVLRYSDDAFGTADAISWRDNTLRIFDLKNGRIPAGKTQLEIYAAFFCLEYQVKPFSIQGDLRIYQNDEIWEIPWDPDSVFKIIDKLITYNKRLELLKREGLS